jgi:hypothetical protein
MRRAAVAFGLVFAAGVVALAVAGLTRGSDLVYSPGALASTPVAQLGTGDRACEGRYRVPSGEPFDRVAFSLGTNGSPGAPIRVEVLDGGRAVATGRLPGGYPDATRHVVRVGRVETGAPLQICLVQEGGPRVIVYGQADFAAPSTTATLNGKPIGADMAITLHTRERSLLALLPDMAARAARFRAGWITPVVYAILGLLVLVGAPLLLARGLARAAAEDGDART